MTTVLATELRKCLGGILNQSISVSTKEFSCVRKHLLPTSRLFSSLTTMDAATDEHFNRFLSQVTLKVRGSDEAVLDSYTQFIHRAATIMNINVSGKVVLPRHIEKRTLLKSPHIYKKHRVQYELRTHARMLQMRELTGDTGDIFLEYIQRNIPEGVSMSVEQTELESIPEYINSLNSS